LAGLAHSCASSRSDGGGIVHPYFLSRMLFTLEQQSRLLPEMETSSAAFLRAQKPLTERLSRTPGLAIF